MKELLKERRSTEVEECRSTVVAEGGVTQKAAAGSRSSETEGDLFVSEVGVRQKDTEEGQEPFGQVKAPPQKRRAVNTGRVGGDTRLCRSTSADELHGAENGGGGRESNGGAELLHMCD